MKRVKHSVAVVVQAEGPRARDRILLVQRPRDEDELPGEWGLPAASLRESETWEDAVRRIGRDKLGARLEPVAELREGTLERTEYLLHMKLFEARLDVGEPRVPQPVQDVTQYDDWRWGDPSDLVPAARRGSLCSRLYLRERGRGWTP